MPADTPDFDNMSMEEMMKWMETLAKRQGADESGFLTSADASVQEIDPDTVTLNMPGYVPFGEDTKKKPAAAAPEPPKKPEPAPTPPAKPADGGLDDFLSGLTGAPTPPAQTPPPVAQTPPPTPSPAPVAPAASADAAPDFDNMSMEEMMKWMETLAKRQGADESGFLTSADASVQEIDPDTVTLNMPGYVPFGEDTKKKPAAAAPEPPKKPEPKPAKPADGGLDDFLSGLTGAPTPAPAAQTPSPQADDLSWLTSLAGEAAPAAPDLPDFAALDDLSAQLGSVLDSAAQPEADTLSWLDSLSASAPPTPAAAPSAAEVSDPLEAGVDPLTWLESLAQRQGANPEELVTGGGMNVPQPDPNRATISSPGYEGYNVDNEGKSAPLAAFDDDEDDGEDEPVEDATDIRAWLGDLANDPSVQSRVTKFDPNPQPASPAKKTGDPIADMLNAGITPDPDQMAAWLGSKMDELLEAPPMEAPVAEEDDAAFFDDDAPPVPAELPDWMQEIAPQPPVEEDAPAVAADLSALGIEAPNFFSQQPADNDLPDFLQMADSASQEESEPLPLTDEIVAPQVDMPDWLREDIPMSGESLADIFDMPANTPPPAALSKPQTRELDPALVARFDPSQAHMDDDPWVQAIGQEQEADPQLEQWYNQRLNDPSRQAMVDDIATPKLVPVTLPPEFELPQGQREPIPNWLALIGTAGAQSAAAPVAPSVAAPAVQGDMPDWLLMSVEADAPAVEESASDMPDWLMETVDTDSVNTSDIPDWLLETIEEEIPEPSAPAQIAAPTPAAPQSQPVVSAPAPTPVPAPKPLAASPVPVPTYAQINVADVLNQARAGVQRGNLDEAVDAYEAVVRSNQQLQSVVNELAEVIRANKEFAPAYRVLGDALMRQGKLQQALDTYRKALNLL